jgi:hypothetical protein
MIKQTDVTVEELHGFATAVGLDRVAAGRCVSLFLFQLYAGTVLTPALGDAPKIVAEIERLEGTGRITGTKAAEPFKKPPLLGLKKRALSSWRSIVSGYEHYSGGWKGEGRVSPDRATAPPNDGALVSSCDC